MSNRVASNAVGTHFVMLLNLVHSTQSDSTIYSLLHYQVHLQFSLPIRSLVVTVNLTQPALARSEGGHEHCQQTLHSHNLQEVGNSQCLMQT